MRVALAVLAFTCLLAPSAAALALPAPVKVEPLALPPLAVRTEAQAVEEPPRAPPPAAPAEPARIVAVPLVAEPVILLVLLDEPEPAAKASLLDAKLARLERAEAEALHGRGAVAPAQVPEAAAPIGRAPDAAIAESAPAPAAAEPPSRPRDNADAARGAPAPPRPERASPAFDTMLFASAAGLAVVLGALYHRLRGADVLAHAPRARLLAHLRDGRAHTPAEAARALGVDPSTALYHLRRLVREGLVVAEGPPRAARYFAAGALAPAARPPLTVPQRATDVLDEVRASPGASKTDIARRLAIARATVAWHLARLERAGLVRCEREGRSVRAFAKETLS